jgi:predicted short-subunit dehydrogenase-like oxidoreductase (DUF2520 family)
MDEISPRLAKVRIGFVGAGRLGTALAWSMAQRGLNVAAAASATRSSADRLIAPIRGCRVENIQDVVDMCDLVFITTPDRSIGTTTAQARWRAGKSVVHCSGVTEVAALDAAVREGALVGGFHPMQTFGEPQAAVASLPGCTITIEAEEPLFGVLVALAQHLECRVNRLPPGMRGRYHAAAGYGSQFINALLREASRIWQSWGATEEDSVRALLPMARGTLAAIASAGLADAMPGPVSRGDVSSVEKHLAALAHLDPDVTESYRLLCGRTVALALDRGAIDGTTAGRIRELLAQAHSAHKSN